MKVQVTATTKRLKDLKQVQSWFNSLPNRFHEGPEMPVLLPDTWEWEEDHPRGFYQYNPGQVLLPYGLPGGKVVFTHEALHWLYFKVLTEQERGEWFTLWKRFKDQIPEYGRTNREEGFAVCGTRFINRNDVPKQIRIFLRRVLQG